MVILGAFLLLLGLASPQIEIDGDVSEWDTAGIQPAYADKLGDTQPWLRDPKMVGVGSTAEPPEKVKMNDKCRDLKAVYFYADENWIYIRLDVNQLYEGWCVPSQKFYQGRPVAYPYPKVSAYRFFRVPGAVIFAERCSGSQRHKPGRLRVALQHTG